MFLEQYNIPKNSPPEFKFKTIACQYYRQRLESIVDGKQFNGEKPTLEQGLAVIDYSNPNFTPNNKYQSMGSNQSDQEEQSSYNKYLSQLSVFASKAAEKTKETYNKYSEKVKDPEFQQQVKEDTKKSLESAKQGIMSAFGYMKSKAQSLQKPKSDSNFSKQNAQEYQEYFQNDREQMEQFQEERNKFQQQKMKSNQQDDQLI